LLREKTKGISYELVTGLRVTAAIGDIVGALEWLLKSYPTEALGWNCSHWVPALLRRIERDEQAADEIIKAWTMRHRHRHGCRNWPCSDWGARTRPRQGRFSVLHFGTIKRRLRRSLHST
jgi:hypothetical protein